VQADLLAGLRGPFDVITANPPYVAERDRPGLQPEVREFEPSVALFGGFLGLSIIARLIAEATDRLTPAGCLIFEFGAGQDDAVLELISASRGLRMVEVKADLAGIPRVAVAGLA
jgi:release factor glutamine methyltransferase